jgi:hypothetical protein
VSESNDPRFIDGPKFTAWLKEQHYGLEVALELGESTSRRWREWEEGSAIGVYTADRVLTRLGSHLAYVPEEFFCGDPRTGKPKKAVLTKAQQRQITQARRRMSRKAVAEQFGVSARTVDRYANA